MKSPNVCVIGAGASGLVAAKVLHERGVAFDCFEKGSGIGGLWRFNNDNGMSAAYQSLHINSSRYTMAFSDFPMPKSLPDFPHHSDILEYYENYVDHFGFRDQIKFRTSVDSVEPDGNRYCVSIDGPFGKSQHLYDHVIVANGHHWFPKLPTFPGEFSGRSFHSHSYKNPRDLEDKRVLVVGIGNSGCDIACEISRISKRTFLSTRRGAHIIPKYILGKPLDRICPPFFWNHLPFRLFQKLFEVVLRVTRGRLTRFGLPQPPHRILEEHPTVSSDLLNLLGHGRIQMKPNVENMLGHQVQFADGSIEEIDVVIYATGYNIQFPFLLPEILDPIGNEIPLYKRVVHPSLRGLYFIGLVQPCGPLNPLSEAQCQWVTDLIQSLGELPSEAGMLQGIGKTRQQARKRYGDSTRHTIQVDFHPYLKDLKKVRTQCRNRKRRSPDRFDQSNPESSPTPAEIGLRRAS